MRDFFKGHPHTKCASLLALGSTLLFSMTAQATPCNDNIPGKINNRFTDNGNGTVTDTVTRLIWQRCDLSLEMKVANSCSTVGSQYISYSWKGALSEVTKFNITENAAGRPATWRLPNIKELATIVDMNCTNMAIDTKAFPDPSTTYWTSTPVIQFDVIATGINQRQNGAWIVDFRTGVEDQTAVDTATSVRLVR